MLLCQLDLKLSKLTAREIEIRHAPLMYRYNYEFTLAQNEKRIYVKSFEAFAQQKKLFTRITVGNNDKHFQPIGRQLHRIVVLLRGGIISYGSVRRKEFLKISQQN